MTPLRFAELFAGAGGFGMGFERAGWVNAWHCEIADDPRSVLEQRWPDVPLYRDVMLIDGRELTAKHGPIDILIGGSPCQDLSVAGKRRGLVGERSSLFFQQMRLWDETGADLCLWENVDGARSSNEGKDFGYVLGAFVGAAVAVPSDGWRGAGVAAGPRGVAAWRVLDAQFFGVPQRRRRVFVLGTRAGRIDPAEVLSLAESVRGDSPPRGEAGEGTAEGAGGGAAESLGLAINISNGEPRVSGVMGSLQARERAGGVGSGAQMNAVLAFHQTQDPISDAERSPALGVTSSGMGVLAFAENQRGELLLKPVMDSLKIGDGKPGQGFPAVLALDAETNPSSDVMGALNTHHSSHCSPVVCATGETTHALTHEGSDAGEDGTGRGTPIFARCDTAGEGQRNDWETCTVVAPTVVGNGDAHSGFRDADGLAVSVCVPRRLTPRECERLMGWPDDHTLVRNVRGKMMSDAARYRMCGNGVASPVAHWIAWRLALALDGAA